MKEYAVICDNVMDKDCVNCSEPCIMRFSDEEWESYKLFHRDISTALHEQQLIEDDISEYYRLKKELNKEGLMVEEVINININYLRKRKKEVTNRIKKLRQMEYVYTKKLMNLNNKKRRDDKI